MSLPYAFYMSGWVFGMLGLLGIALLSYSTMSLIIQAVHLTRRRLRRRLEAKVQHSIMVTSTRASRRQSMKNIAILNAAMENGTSSSSAPPALSSPSHSYGSSSSPSLHESSTMNGVSYGSMSDEQLDSDPVDPLDLSVIKQDPDLDVIGYQQVAYVAYGEWGRISADSVLIFTQLGSCSAFLVLVLTNLQACFSSYGIMIPLEILSIPIIPMVILLTLPRSTTYLANASHFGNITLLIGVVTIFYFGATDMSSDVAVAISERGWSGMFLTILNLPAYGQSPFNVLVFFGITAFAFAAHCEIVAVEADAKSRAVYAWVLPCSIVFITILYFIVSIYAYACFGSRTRANILLNLGTGFFVNVVRVALSCCLLVNFAMALFPASQTIDLLAIGTAPNSDLPHQHEYTPRGPNAGEFDDSPTSAQHGNEGSSLLPDSWPQAKRPEEAEAMRRESEPHDVDSPEAILERKVSSYHRKGNLIRIGVVLATFAVALLVQDLGVLFSLVGSIAGGLLCFSMPPLFYYRLMVLEREDITMTTKCALLAQMICGATLIGMGLGVVIAAA